MVNTVENFSILSQSSTCTDLRVNAWGREVGGVRVIEGKWLGREGGGLSLLKY